MILREYLRTIADIEMIGECSNGFEAVKKIPELHPDLIFLDIQMPKLSGFEVLELLEELPVTIFATAYDEFALKAFEVHAVDYVLKPFSKERLTEAVEQAKKRLAFHTASPLRTLSATVQTRTAPLERILIKNGSDVVVLPSERIDYIEAQDDYVAIHADGKSHLKQQRMAELEKLLKPTQFVRVHRSIILNIERIARIELYAKDSRMAILKDGTKLLISRSGYEKLKELL
jgi:two-component system LytT family response regulator